MRRRPMMKGFTRFRTFHQNLPSGTYTITAVAFAPKWVPGDVKLMGKIIVVLKEGEHLEGKDIIVDEIDKKLNTIPIPVSPGE